MAKEIKDLINKDVIEFIDKTFYNISSIKNNLENIQESCEHDNIVEYTDNFPMGKMYNRLCTECLLCERVSVTPHVKPPKFKQLENELVYKIDFKNEYIRNLNNLNLLNVHTIYNED